MQSSSKMKDTVVILTLYFNFYILDKYRDTVISSHPSYLPSSTAPNVGHATASAAGTGLADPASLKAQQTTSPQARTPQTNTHQQQQSNGNNVLNFRRFLGEIEHSDLMNTRLSNVNGNVSSDNLWLSNNNNKDLYIQQGHRHITRTDSFRDSFLFNQSFINDNNRVIMDPQFSVNRQGYGNDVKKE